MLYKNYLNTLSTTPIDSVEEDTGDAVAQRNNKVLPVPPFNLKKRNELKEQQHHLHVGLDKLRDTVTQVEELCKSLLKCMVADQQEAEQKKSASIDIQAALLQQNKYIEQCRAITAADVADAEPVLEAQSAVGNIK
ncbi:MAG: hypothetical protein NXY57DRAFT_1090657 [Lentinula lateritia]|nr:MAG: hypothetical protein NXY57DRAFT_1090657 [Lentinula lateritia]